MRTIQTQDLVSIRDIGGHARGAFAVSPDGRWIAFQIQEPELEANTFRLTWYVVELGSRQRGPRRVGDGGEIIFDPSLPTTITGNRAAMSATWTRDSRSIIYLKRQGHSTQLWRSYLDGRETQLTSGTRDVISIIDVTGSRIRYSVARDEHDIDTSLRSEGRSGYLVDNRFRPFVSNAPVRQQCNTPEEISLRRDCEPPIWEYDLLTRRNMPATALRSDIVEEDQRIAGRISAQGSGEGRITWFERVDRDTPHLSGPSFRLVATADDGREVACTAPMCTVEHPEAVFWGAQDEEVFALHRNAGATSFTLFAWTLDSGAVREVLTTDNRLSACQRIQDNAFCLSEGPIQPRRIVSVNLGNGQVDTVFDPNPEFAQIQFTRIENLEWNDGYGNAVTGRLVFPRDYVEGQRYPIIITPYDASGFLRGDTGDEFPIHVFASAGFFVLCASRPRDREIAVASPNYRLRTTERELRKRRVYLSSVEAILDILDRRGLYDPTRVGMTGVSDGAQQVHFALINTQRITAAAVGSLVSPQTFYEFEAPFMRERMRDWWGGQPSPSLSSYSALSYRSNAETIGAPILVNVSDAEFVVSHPEFAYMQDAGRAIEMYVYPNEQHIIWQPAHRLAIYNRNLDWFRFWLQDVEDPDPAKVEQYVRWRQLRELQCRNPRSLRDYCNVASVQAPIVR